MAKAITDCGELSPNDKNGPCPDSGDRPLPCWCRKDPWHEGGHECRCGEEWPRRDERDLANLVERITITELRPGDVVLIEVDARLSDEELVRFKAELDSSMPQGVRAAVLEQARLRGVLRAAPEVT